jgi:hypothetical protein
LIWRAIICCLCWELIPWLFFLLKTLGLIIL